MRAVKLAIVAAASGRAQIFRRPNNEPPGGRPLKTIALHGTATSPFPPAEPALTTRIKW